MQFKTHRAKHIKSTILTSVIVLFNLFISIAQNDISENFEDRLSESLYSRPTGFDEIRALFSKFEKDSIKMRILVNKFEAASYFEGESYALNALGIIYRNISNYKKAITLHDYAKQVASYTENTELKVYSLNMLGVVYRRMDLISSALDYHSQALEFASAVDPITEALRLSIAVSQNSMGNIYLVLKQYDLALDQFTKSLEIEKRINNKLGLAINYQNIGYAKEAKGLLDEALIDYQTSLSFNEEIDSEVGRVICFNSIGIVYIKQDKFEEALEIIESALEKALIIEDQFYIATSYVNLGNVLSKLNRTNRARSSLNKAISIANEFNLLTPKVEALELLSDTENAIGEHKRALEHYKQAISLEQTINNQRNLSYINDLIIKYESENKSNTIKTLANENALVKSSLEKNRLALLFALLAIILISIALIIVQRHKQITQEKQIIALEQNMLRNQMNPHFIFNSLNSIKLYIINNEKENAVYYLNKFAKLIRKILVASNEKDISLADELETMQLYINIENIRFSNEIDYTINLSEHVNPKNIRVPSLILQPFLENALWHGLSSKTDNKKIDLKIEQNNDEFITITIKDNGIGRVASQAIKSKKTLNRKSVGIAITKERLFNFSQRFTNMYQLNIVDLFDEHQKASGTKVVLKIPIAQLIS